MIHTLTPNPSLDLRLYVDAPELGQLNRASREEFEASGKGLNVARALSEQDVPVRAVLPLGGPTGAHLLALLAGLPLQVETVLWEGTTRINVKVLDRQGGVSEFNSPGPRVTHGEWQRLEERLLQGIKPGDWVALSGSLPLGISAEDYLTLIRRLHHQGVFVALDAGGRLLRDCLSERPELIKPNLREAEEALGQTLVSLEELRDAALQLHSLGARTVVLSMGAEGAVFTGTQVCWAQPPQSPIAQTLGCGDALLAGTLAGLTRGLSWCDTARLASAWALGRALRPGPEFPKATHTAPLLPLIQVKPL